MKILFYIGETVDIATKLTIGKLTFTDNFPEIEFSEGKLVLDDMVSVNLKKLYQVGTMIEIESVNQKLFMVVPWFYLDIGSGFALVNLIRTIKTSKKLQEFM